MKRFIIALASIGLASACQKKSEPAQQTGTAPPAASALASAAPAEAEDGPKADEMTLQSGLGKPKIPDDNPQSPAKIQLGHQLFFDERLSGDNSLSCYSCHQNEDGTGGHDPIAIGAGKKKLTRHSPVLYNVAYLPKLYWDGRASSLEEQITQALVGGNMGVGKDNLARKVAEIAGVEHYPLLFQAAFSKEGATPETLVKALASYLRTLVCDDTAYDRYAAGKKDALSAEQKRGLELFMGKAGCVACHTPPFFSSAYIVREGAYFNVGIGFEGKHEPEIDVGRKKVSNAELDFGAFKVPTLRNVTKSAPYFHDGSQAKLEDAVRFMASGGFKNEHLTPLMVDRKLSDADVKNIVSFLGALECKPLAKPLGAW